MSLPPAARRRIAALCRDSGARFVGSWELGDPSRWFPTTVTDPSTDLPFTHAGAWEYVACLIEQGESLKQVRLKEPNGCIGYEIHVTCNDGRSLYIKFRLIKDRVIGRSFHYSDRP